MSFSMRFEITNRARTYGYLIWPKELDDVVEKLFPPNAQEIEVFLNQRFLGPKRIDRKYRRISLGYKFTRALPEAQTIFQVSVSKDGKLNIKTICS
jgi:hypothetical protein